MGKSENDEAYERGVRDGLDGDFFDDLTNCFVFKAGDEKEEIYWKGHKWGVEHRTYKEPEKKTDSTSSWEDFWGTKEEAEEQEEPVRETSYGGSDYSSDSSYSTTSADITFYGFCKVMAVIILIIGSIAGICVLIYNEDVKQTKRMEEIEKSLDDSFANYDFRSSKKIFLNEKEIYVTVNGVILAKTIDGGKTWESSILKSLDMFFDDWIFRNRKRLSLTPRIGGRFPGYSDEPNSYDHWAKNNNDIWVIGGIPYSSPGDFHTKTFILHSPDNGTTWQIKWEKPATHTGVFAEDYEYTNTLWYFVSLNKIQIVNENRICFKLTALTKPLMLYTIDKGNTWKIYGKWNPRKVKKIVDEN